MIHFNIDYFLLHLTRPGVSGTVLVATLVVSAILSFWVIASTKKHKTKRLLQVWIIACLFLMIDITVIERLSKQTSTGYQLIPFSSIGTIQSGLIETLYEKIFNVLFFVPYGCLLGTYFRHKTFMKAVVLGVATSVGIELIQLLTHTGTCEIDDVICNTFGCVIGTGTVITCKKIYEKFFLL